MNEGVKRSSVFSSVARGSLILALGAAPVLMAAFGLASCGQREIVAVQAPKACELQMVTLTVIASPMINPTEKGETRPVQLRIYQLKNNIRFENASFQQIWKKDKETLADDLVKVDELSVYPDSRTDVKFERSKDALDVIGVALFRNPKGRSWYTTFELPPDPGKGACGLPVDDPNCPDGKCADAGPILNPKYAIWIDQNRVDVGDDHLDDYPVDGGRISVIHLSSGGGAPGAPGAPGGPPGPPGGAPDLPAPPTPQPPSPPSLPATP